MRGCRVVATTLIALLASGCYAGSREAGVQQGPYAVVRAVDGDTIRVVREGQEIVVRLIGINTPETVAPDRPVECFGPEASERTKQLVTGQKVWLEYDDVTGETDKYARTLAYVWLTPDQMLNEELVREGYAEERTYQEGYRYQDRLRDAEEAAQGAGAGLWSACP
ncbi:MAG: thermonuclease family protein [Actinomycetota bacterium]